MSTMDKNIYLDDEILDPDVEFFDFLMKTKEIFSQMSVPSDDDNKDDSLEVERDVQNLNISEPEEQSVFSEDCDNKESKEEDADREFENFITKMKQGFSSEVNKENQSPHIFKCPSPSMKQGPSMKQRSYSCANESFNSRAISFKERSKSEDFELSFNMFCEETETIQIFTKNRDIYTKKLYTFFNKRIFNNRLPEDMVIKWSDLLTKTAGLCHCRKGRDGVYSCYIDLSTKVNTSFDRLRDTLLHELCHAAVWLVNKSRCNHGPLWKTWAVRCKLILPDIELPDTCHKYAIFYPFTYICSACKWQKSRHSKSSKLQSSCPKCGKLMYIVYN